MTPQNPVPNPDLTALLDRMRLRVFLELNCHQWGIVKSFNAAAQTATVQVAVLRQVADTTTDPATLVPKAYPILLDVPVMILTGGKAGVTLPIAVGDTCLLLFNDRDMDEFWNSGSVVIPNSSRAHDFSDALAIIGFRTKANALTAYDTTKAKFYNDTTFITLGTKIKAANATQSLHDVLTSFVTAVKGYTDTHGDTASAGTLTALTAVQTAIDALLE